jgi:predicted RNA polymerase sigma factor
VRAPPATRPAACSPWAGGGPSAGSHLLPSVRGELLARLGRTDEAREELGLAVDLCGNDRERDLLERKRAGLTAARSPGP